MLHDSLLRCLRLLYALPRSYSSQIIINDVQVLMSTDRLGCTDIVLWMRNDSNCVKTNIFFKQPQYSNNFCLATISCWHDCRNKCSRHDFVFYFPHAFPQINRRVVLGELDSLWPVISEQKLQNSRSLPPLFWQIAFCWMFVSTCSYRWVNRFHFGLHLTFCSALCCCGIPEVWVSECVRAYVSVSFPYSLFIVHERYIAAKQHALDVSLSGETSS